MKAAGSLKIIDVRLGKAILYGRQNKFELTDEKSVERTVETRRLTAEAVRMLSIIVKILVVKLLRAHDGCLGIGRR